MAAPITVKVKDAVTGDPITTAEVCIKLSSQCCSPDWQPVDQNGEYGADYAAGDFDICAREGGVIKNKERYHDGLEELIVRFKF